MTKMHKYIPSMFHRRLLLLLALCAVIFVALTVQAYRLTVLEGAERRSIAEARLERHIFLPTYRGRILDRHGRVLAQDRASYDVAVEYDVIIGAWPRAKAVAQARRELGRSTWLSMSPEQREAAIRERQGQWEAQCEQLWFEIRRLGNLTHEELQKRLDAIKADVLAKASASWERQWRAENKKFGIAESEFKYQPIREQTQPHVVLPRVSNEVAFAFMRLAERWPDMLEVQDSRRREYPWLTAEVPLSRASLPRSIRSNETQIVPVFGVADHILGGMRDEIWAEDVQRRPFVDPATREVVDLGGYRPGDAAGSRGVERVFEDVLRGLRGQVRERKDTGEQVRIEPQPGRDLQLTLDIALQARVQAILSPEYGLTKVQPWQNNTALPVGTPLNAAAVVLEVETGEILAMVTMPTMAMGEVMTEEQRKANQPVVNRASEGVYPPGSILKPLTLAAAVTEGVHDLNASINCTGHYFENNPNVARCWIYRSRFGMRSHGPLKAEEALARSCNIFFYTMGDRLGMKRQVDWLRRFGLGQLLHAGLLQRDKDGTIIWQGESAGQVPSDELIEERRRKGQLKFSEVIMGIGQGEITWTPLQAANAYATLARGGIVRDATLVMNESLLNRPRRCEDFPLSKRLVDAVLEGLRQSVGEEYGTGHHINYEPGTPRDIIIDAQDVTVWAKTGTAQAYKLPGSDVSVDHAWFVGLVGPKGAKRPTQAIAVLVEKGGSGGRTAGPIANQIIRALQAEGYLPGDPNASPVTTGRGQSIVEPEDDGGDD